MILDRKLLGIARHMTWKRAAGEMGGGAMPPMDPSMMGGAPPPVPGPVPVPTTAGAPMAGPQPAAGGAGAAGGKPKFDPLMLDYRAYNMQQCLTAIMNALGVQLPPESIVLPPGTNGAPPAEQALPGGPTAPQPQPAGGPGQGGQPGIPPMEGMQGVGPTTGSPDKAAAVHRLIYDFLTADASPEEKLAGARALVGRIVEKRARLAQQLWDEAPYAPILTAARPLDIISTARTLLRARG